MNDIRRHITSHRKDFSDDSLDGHSLYEDPLKQFEEWLAEAVKSGVNEAYAVTLSTIGHDGYPSSRIVYLRGIEDGGLIFYTNYNSLKGTELAIEDKAVMNFFWPEMHKQVKVKGIVSKVSKKTSDAYFASRPRGSQLGAWASEQSRPLESRELLEARLRELEEEYKGKDIPRPEHWGGYTLKATEWEFWKGRSSRLHDRFKYSALADHWKISRLYP